MALELLPGKVHIPFDILEEANTPNTLICLFLAFGLRICFIWECLLQAEKAAWAGPGGAECGSLPHGRSASLKNEELLCLSNLRTLSVVIM